MSSDGRKLRLSVPGGVAKANPALVAEVERLFGELHQGSCEALAALSDIAQENPHSLRVSHRLESWVAVRSTSERRLERVRFEEDLKAGRRSMDMLKLPLLPYPALPASSLPSKSPQDVRSSACSGRKTPIVAIHATTSARLSGPGQSRIRRTAVTRLWPSRSVPTMWRSAGSQGGSTGAVRLTPIGPLNEIWFRPWAGLSRRDAANAARWNQLSVVVSNAKSVSAVSRVTP